MKILFIGDVVSQQGRDAVKDILPGLRKKEDIDLVIANAENLAHGRGATTELIHEMQGYGVDYFTGGDHLFWQKEFEEEIDKLPVIRPANYPPDTPGPGYAIIDVPGKGTVLLINLIGRTSFGSTNSLLDDPFRTADEILKQYVGAKPEIILIDFHAEATSEKAALGFYLDGQVDAIVGTHTHIPTCDTRILPKGTMFVTDIGMTGNIDSVLGVKKEIIIKMFLTAHNQRFEWENAGKSAFRSVILDTQKKTITRFDQEV